MASWKKVIVSGSQAHLQSITASGDVSASGNLSITGTSTLTGRLTANGAITTTNLTASGNISSSAALIGQTLSLSGAGTIGGLLTANGAITTTNLTASGNISSSGDLFVTGTSTLTGRLSANGAITTTNLTASGNISSSGNLILTGNITASGLPNSTTPQLVGYNTTTGGLTYFDTSSIVAGAAAAVQTFKTISVGGISLVADSSTDTLTIASGSFGGVATTRNNLRLSGSQDDTLTISFLDSPTFTDITASGNISSSAGLIGQTLQTSGNVTVGNQLSVNSGTISRSTNGTATIFNTNASQIDMGGAATTINIGGTDTQTNFNGSVQLGNNSSDQITLGGGTTDTVVVQGLFTIGDNLLNSNLIPYANNTTVIGSSSKAIQSIVVNQITASGLPQTAPGSRNILMIDTASGAIVRVTAASLGNVVGVDSFKTISIGGLGTGTGGSVAADSSTDTLIISSSDANLIISASGDNLDTITFDFADSPSFTNLTNTNSASFGGNFTPTARVHVSGSGDNRIRIQSNPTNEASLDFKTDNTANDFGLRIVREAGTNGSTTIGHKGTGILYIATLDTGSLHLATYNTTRVFVSSSGNVGIGTTSPAERLHVDGNLLVTGDLAVNGGDITTTSTTFDLVNTNATTINFGGGATTALNIGAATGTTTVKNNLAVDGNATITGNLTVNGDTTIINTAQLLVEDKFVILASGSIASNPQDSGIIVQTTTGSSGIGSGSALFLNGAEVPSNGTSRWGLAQNIPHNATTVTPTDYIMSVSSSTSDPTLAPTYGSASAGFGNVHINTQSKTIWMYI